ncbi:hypothetical protein BDZ45DRAFT_52420 [Acephala macrosclerotiorum]|nr:hypothetical protein BDZ45DRAFT_52420 [Acephala macrosclerotiorum]
MATINPQKPSDSELIEMIRGPQVNIYVGPEKKHYSLPKNLLCHYSDYFDRCFNGNFADAQIQQLELPEDKVEDFDIILEYLLHGRVTSEAKIRSVGQNGLSECMNFIIYVDKYNLGEVSAAVMEPLKKVLTTKFFTGNLEVGSDIALDDGRPKIEEQHIETVFKFTPSNSPVRTLIAQAAVSCAGMKKCAFTYQKQIAEVPGFALELLRQIERTMGAHEWKDPLTGQRRGGGNDR